MTLDDTSVLDHLNSAERDILTLLAQGHTAKSIAGVRAVTEAAVNERLRSARRKTGVGSSRELARLVVAQENRDDLIDLAAAPTSVASLRRPDAPPSRDAFLTRRWRLIVITAALLAAGLLAYETVTPPQAPTSPVADILAGLAPSPDVVSLHAEASAPSTNKAWSSASEQLLSQRYRALPGFESRIEALSVTCSTNLCEVAGKARPNISGADLDAFMEGVQSLDRAEPHLPLQAVVHHFSSTNGPNAAARFASYWRPAG